MLSDWLPFLIYALLAAAIPATMSSSRSFSRRDPGRARRSGCSRSSRRLAACSPEERRFTVSFYLTAMLFILFDIEIVFLYPLAVQLEALAWFGLVEFLTFVAILGVAYVYVWRKGALEWR